MKESMNLKDLKNSNTLVSVFVDDLSSLNTLEETFYSISKQTSEIDFLVMYSEKFEKTDVQKIEDILKKPKITLRKQNEKGEIESETVETDGKINYKLLASSLDNFSKIFNETFNIANQNEYKYFSVIESNDVVGINWYAQARLYASENPDVGMLIPMVRNTVNGVFAGILNEAPWAEGMAEEAGKADLNLLQRFNCIAPLAALIDVEVIKEYSEERDGVYYPFKESMKISHYYEFLMRMIYNDVKVMTVPRIGYEFRIITKNVFRHTSCKIPQNLTQIPFENGGLMPEEAKFWMDLAKKEYFFDEDRNKIYEQSEKK